MTLSRYTTPGLDTIQGGARPATPAERALFDKHESKAFKQRLADTAGQAIAANLPLTVEWEARWNASGLLSENQPFGECTSCATVAGMEWLEIQAGQSPPCQLSAMALYWHQRLAQGNINDDTGSSVYLAAYEATIIGVCAEALWPISRVWNVPAGQDPSQWGHALMRQQPDAAAEADMPKRKLLEYASVDHIFTGESVDPLLYVLAQGWPVTFQRGNHAMVLLGYVIVDRVKGWGFGTGLNSYGPGRDRVQIDFTDFSQLYGMVALKRVDSSAPAIPLGTPPLPQGVNVTISDNIITLANQIKANPDPNACTPVQKTQMQSYANQLQAGGTTAFTLSGAITLNGVSLAGVAIGGVATNTQGQFSVSVAQGASGTLIPVLSGYTFVPASYPYSNLAANAVQNFAATAAQSGGEVGKGVTLTAANGDTYIIDAWDRACRNGVQTSDPYYAQKLRLVNGVVQAMRKDWEFTWAYFNLTTNKWVRV